MQEEAQKVSPERRFGLRFRITRKGIAVSAVLLAVWALFFALNPQLFFGGPIEKPLPFQWGHTLLYGIFLFGCVMLCFLEVTLPYALRAVVGWTVLPVLPLLSFIAVDNINETRIADFRFTTLLANYIGYLMVFSLIFALSRRVWATAAVGGGIFLLFGIANYFTAEFRGAPILPWDIQTVSTAFSVAGGYHYEMTVPIAVSLLVYLWLCFFCYRVCPRGKYQTTRRFRVAERLGALTLSSLLFFMIFSADILTDLGISVWAWNQKTSSTLTGVTAGFFANVQYLLVDKPEGYSRQRVEELHKGIQELPEPEALGAPDGTPTIIAVMNESFTDFSAVGEGRVSFSPDNLPFLHKLQESGQAIWGTAYSSVYGGNTCNSEYEFLTGNSLSFLPNGSKPYQQYVDKEQTSLVSTLKDYGYRCVAIHPGQRSAWSRDTAYPYLGFDEFLDVRTFTVSRTLEHNLTSDGSCYDQVIHEYENRGDSPLFLFNVTIQNHGGYEDEDYPTTVRLQEAAGQFPQAEQYLSLTKSSDKALEEMLTYFSQQKDPVVVLFFGDHWPNLETEFLSLLLGENAETPSFETVMKERQVPFLLWANYPLKSQEIQQVSLNYLSGLLLRAAGIEGSDYIKFLELARETFPVITADGKIDKNGNLYKTGDATPYDQLLNDYAILQYNNAFGNGEKVMDVFTPDI